MEPGLVVSDLKDLARIINKLPFDRTFQNSADNFGCFSQPAEWSIKREGAAWFRIIPCLMNL